MEFDIRELRSFVNRGKFFNSNFTVIKQDEWKHSGVCIQKLSTVIITDNKTNQTFKIRNLKRMVSERGVWHPRMDEIEISMVG